MSACGNISTLKIEKIKMTRDFCNYLYCFYFLDLHNNPPFVLSCEIGLCKVVVEIGMDLTQALEFFLNLT